MSRRKLVCVTIFLFSLMTGEVVSQDGNFMKVTSLLIPLDCDSRVPNFRIETYLNNFTNQQVSMNELIHLNNEPIISSIAKDEDTFILTDKQLMKVKNFKVVDKENVQKVESNLPPVFTLKKFSGEMFLILCFKNNCTFFNPKNLSDSKIFNMHTVPSLNSGFDDDATYNYAPIGKYSRTNENTSCQKIGHFFVTIDSDKVTSDGIETFNGIVTPKSIKIIWNENHENIIYFFQAKKSSFLVKYNNNDFLTILEMSKSESGFQKRTTDYKCQNVVGTFFDLTVSKLYVTFIETKNDLIIGWIDPFNTSGANHLKPLQEIEKLPLKTFKEFVIFNGKKIFNLGLELVLIDRNETISLVRMNQSISLDNSMEINPELIFSGRSNSKKSIYGNFDMDADIKQDKNYKIIIHTNDSVYVLRDKSRNSTPYITAVIAPVSILIIILIASMTTCFFKRMKRNTRNIADDIPGRMSISDVVLEPEPESEPIPKDVVRQPIFIFEDKLSDIIVLSRGAFGEVSKGIYDDGVNRHQVAIKSLFKYDADKLKQEAEIACSLNHPNVLSVIGICYARNRRLKLVLPFMVNGDLANYLDKLWNGQVGHHDGHVGHHDGQVGKVGVSGSLLRLFASQIASGMAYLVADDLGHPSIIHRDLAARNCMVDRDSTIKVADFGLSRHLDESKQRVRRTLQTSMIPVSSAPESLSRLIFNEKTDVWSYGSLLIELYNCDIEMVPQKIIDLSSACHSINPEERPTFKQISSSLKCLSDADFEPVIEQMAPLLTPMETAHGCSEEISLESFDRISEQLLGMIQAPKILTDTNEEIENGIRKQSLDEIVMEEITDESLSESSVPKGSRLKGYVNPGTVPELSFKNSSTALNDFSLNSYSNVNEYKGLDYKESKEIEERLKCNNGPSTDYVTPGAMRKVLAN